jgi:hypothetical protein
MVIPQQEEDMGWKFAQILFKSWQLHNFLP